MLVRTLLMRRTMHLLSAADCLALRALHQPMLAQRSRSVLRSRLVGVDEAELAAAGYPLFHAEPRLLTEVGRAVQERWPDAAPRDLGDVLSSLVPLVQVPPRGLWRQSGPARNTTIAAWLGRDLAPAPEPDELVLRYLAAFGPAAGADIRAWSGLSGLRPAVERLRPDLRTFRDERGRLLLDLPDAPLPDPDTPAPPRFLPAFDNAVLGYDDRSRIIDDADRGLSVTGARFLLVDGRVRATWTVETDGRDGRAADLPARRLQPRPAGDEVTEEGLRLLAFLAPASTASAGPTVPPPVAHRLARTQVQLVRGPGNLCASGVAGGRGGGQRRGPGRVAADEAEQPGLDVGVVGHRHRAGRTGRRSGCISSIGSIPASSSAQSSGSSRSSWPVARARSQVCMNTSEV